MFGQLVCCVYIHLCGLSSLNSTEQLVLCYGGQGAPVTLKCPKQGDLSQDTF